MLRTNNIILARWGVEVYATVNYYRTVYGLVIAGVTNVFVCYPNGTPVTPKDPSWLLGVTGWVYTQLKGQTWWATL